MYIHRGRYLQRGRGVGSVLSSFFKTIFPFAKSVGRSVAKSPLTKKVLTSAKNSAIDAGLNIAADALSGENVGAAVKKGFKEGGKNVASVIRSRPKRAAVVKKKRGKGGQKKIVKRRKISDIYDT
jgi:hypothetical protein